VQAALVRVGAPILVEEDLLDDHGLGGMTLVEKLAHEAARTGLVIPPGEWKSLSMELVLALNVMTRRPKPS
jgi:hypothetical protein